MQRSKFNVLCLSLATLFVTTLTLRTQAAPSIVSAYSKTFSIKTLLANFPGHPTQMAWGPNGRLYIATSDTGVHSYAYNKTTGALSNHIVAVPDLNGLGIAFFNYNKTTTMFLSVYGPNGSHSSGIYKLTDDNHNGVWGEKGEKKIPIVLGLPTGDHDVDNLQVINYSLYVGIGRRTINGRKGLYTSGSLNDYGGTGFWSGGNGETWGDSAYNGTISYIPDLRTVVDAVNSANTWTDYAQTQQLIQTDDTPFTTVATNKLIVHSAGCRNPFGLAVDKTGHLYFTNNFNRVHTNGDGTAGPGYFHGAIGTGADAGFTDDSLGPDFTKDVYDQLFMAVRNADYGYTDENWRGVNPMMNPKHAHYHRQLSTTFDNSFNKGPYAKYDPTHPVGLGPSCSPDGCTFYYGPGLPTELQNNLFICRYNTTITESAPGTHTYTYGDVVAVDTTKGTVRQIASGFISALVIQWDGSNHMIVSDYGNQTLYLITVK